jgi:ABC-2 type transport system ATP-binding protein
MLSSLLKPTSGSFTIDGLDFKTNKRILQQKIGIVPQEYAIYPTLTAHENLMYFGSMYGLKGKDLKEKIATNLDILGLTKFAHKRVGTFSGGMKRRVNLIAGLLHEPSVLFLDEPTVGVDVQSKNVIIDHLLKMNAAGATMIYTSHHLNEAEHFCSRVAIIDEGTIVIEGVPKDLVANDTEAYNLEEVFISLTGKALRDHA